MYVLTVTRINTLDPCNESPDIYLFRTKKESLVKLYELIVTYNRLIKKKPGLDLQKMSEDELKYLIDKSTQDFSYALEDSVSKYHRIVDTGNSWFLQATTDHSGMIIYMEENYLYNPND